MVDRRFLNAFTTVKTRLQEGPKRWVWRLGLLAIVFVLSRFHMLGGVGGQVMDEETGQPLPNAIVVVSWRGPNFDMQGHPLAYMGFREAVTDSEGHFQIPIFFVYKLYGPIRRRLHVVGLHAGFSPTGLMPHEMNSPHEGDPAPADVNQRNLKIWMKRPTKANPATGSYSANVGWSFGLKDFKTTLPRTWCHDEIDGLAHGNGTQYRDKNAEEYCKTIYPKSTKHDSKT